MRICASVGSLLSPRGLGTLLYVYLSSMAALHVRKEKWTISQRLSNLSSPCTITYTHRFLSCSRQARIAQRSFPKHRARAGAHCGRIQGRRHSQALMHAQSACKDYAAANQACCREQCGKSGMPAQALPRRPKHEEQLLQSGYVGAAPDSVVLLTMCNLPHVQVLPYVCLLASLA